MAKFVVSPGRKLTTDSDTDKEHTYVEGDLVEMTKKQAESFVEDGTLYPEGEEPPKKVYGPNEVDPETGLLGSGEANADTPAHLLAPPEQVGPLRETYVPGEDPKDLAHPDPVENRSPTVDDLTPEEIEDLTPPDKRDPRLVEEAVDDETGEVIEDVTEIDTPVDEQEEQPAEPEDN